MQFGLVQLFVLVVMVRTLNHCTDQWVWNAGSIVKAQLLVHALNDNILREASSWLEADSTQNLRKFALQTFTA